MLTEPLIEELHNLRTEEQKPPGLCCWFQGFLFPARSVRAAGRTGVGFVSTVTEGARQFCLGMMRTLPAHGWGQDHTSSAALQRCRWSFLPDKASFLLGLLLLHSSSSCLGIDSGAHRLAGDREVFPVIFMH